jgi:hypothetical protein
MTVCVALRSSLGVAKHSMNSGHLRFGLAQRTFDAGFAQEGHSSCLERWRGWGF